MLQTETLEFAGLDKERRQVRQFSKGMKQRVLIAEDNPVNQRVAVGLLRKIGHEVTVTNGVRADECGTLLTSFFGAKRAEASAPAETRDEMDDA